LNAPSVVILAGPNGAGKSTAAPALLKGLLSVSLFVNADTIARGLAAFAPEDAALPAGRIMLERVRELIQRRITFAIETTLASRTLASLVRDEAVPLGFRLHLAFLWLPTAEMAIARVRERVCLGGHGVPEATIRRRYKLGIRNLFQLYQPLATTWRVYNSADPGGPQLIARATRGRAPIIRRPDEWAAIQEQARE